MVPVLVGAAKLSNAKSKQIKQDCANILVRATIGRYIFIYIQLLNFEFVVDQLERVNLCKFQKMNQCL